MPLYHHTPHPHKPVNVNAQYAAKLETVGVNTKIAVGLTRITGTMPTAYSFAVLSLVGLLAILGILPPLVALLVVWASQTFIQLVMLPILSVGQNVLGHHAELMADEQFKTTQETYHDIEQIMTHLDLQDEKILEIAEKVQTVEQIAATEILKQSDLLEEILDLVKSHAQPVALIDAAPLPKDSPVPLPPAALRLPPSTAKQVRGKGSKDSV